MSFGDVKTGGISSVAIVTVHTFSEMRVVGQRLRRNIETLLISFPEFLFAMTLGADIFLRRQMRTGWRLGDKIAG